MEFLINYVEFQTNSGHAVSFSLDIQNAPLTIVEKDSEKKLLGMASRLLIKAKNKSG